MDEKSASTPVSERIDEGREVVRLPNGAVDAVVVDRRDGWQELFNGEEEATEESDRSLDAKEDVTMPVKREATGLTFAVLPPATGTPSPVGTVETPVRPVQRSKARQALSRWTRDIWRCLTDLWFDDPELERQYLKAESKQNKAAMLAVSIVFVCLWPLSWCFDPQPYDSYVVVIYIILGGVSVVFLPPSVLLDVPHRFPWVWQALVFVATWFLASAEIFDIWHCGAWVLVAGG